jgi:hypothetical protein
MSEISSQRFSVRKALRQGRDLSGLVQKNGWLEDSPYSGASSRYGRGPARAALGVARVSHNSGGNFGAFVLYGRDKDQPFRAIGLGTVICCQEVTAKVRGNDVPFVGTDIDYWLDETAGEVSGTHDAAARLMVTLGANMAHGNGQTFQSGRPESPYYAPLMATVLPGQENQPIGFQGVMKPFGEIGPLTNVADPVDRLGITKGVPLQLYTGVVAMRRSAQKLAESY